MDVVSSPIVMIRYMLSNTIAIPASMVNLYRLSVGSFPIASAPVIVHSPSKPSK